MGGIYAMKVAYICDCEMDCKTSCGCCINGGPCQHTTDIRHAKNFEETPIIIGNDKFEDVTPDDMKGEVHYMERPV
jgi:hypothetical protein